ncbi:hypothetical protein TNCV_2067761 [Trichonephila clavipes]|uniref:Uncharacterized protein n=1 Tax=Trichonephila clavipes TaxID=2585209 RepID=A0A8X6W2N8_TRICX|nr:hypothetical protein TNCV_2067761 [Trichonephila clavipes]
MENRLIDLRIQKVRVDLQRHHDSNSRLDTNSLELTTMVTQLLQLVFMNDSLKSNTRAIGDGSRELIGQVMRTTPDLAPSLQITKLMEGH